MRGERKSRGERARQRKARPIMKPNKTTCTYSELTVHRKQNRRKVVFFFLTFGVLSKRKIHIPKMHTVVLPLETIKWGSEVYSLWMTWDSFLLKTGAQKAGST